MYGRSASRKPNSTECISKGGSQHTPVDAQHAFRRRAFMRLPNMTHSEGRARLILGTQTAQNASKGVLQHTPMLSMHSAGVLLPNRSSGIPPTCCIPNGVTPKQRSNAHNASAPSCRPHTASHHFQACMHWCAPICWSLRSSRGICSCPDIPSTLSQNIRMLTMPTQPDYHTRLGPQATQLFTVQKYIVMTHHTRYECKLSDKTRTTKPHTLVGQQPPS